MESGSANTIQLDDAMLDMAAGTLSRNGAIVALRPKSFQLLCHLASRGGQVVTKSDLMDAIWPDVFVTEDSLTQAVRDVRTALKDDAGRRLQTIRGRGYLLDTASPSPAAKPAAGTHLPRIAVLPFTLRPPRDDLLPRVEMLAEEIAAGLARYRTLRVLSTVSARRAASESDDPAEIAARLGADYLIDGTALAGQDGFLLRLSLTRAEAEALVWSETFDCQGAAILDAQSGIVRRVLAHLLTGIESEGHARAQTRATESLTAYDHLARGQALWSSDDPDLARKSLAHFEAAVAADSEFGLAWTHLGWAELTVHEYSLAPPEVMQRALDRARRGVSLAPYDGRTHTGLAYIQALVGDFAAAGANVAVGLRLNPSSVDCLMDHATVSIARGRPIEALALLDEVKDLCPMRVSYDAHMRGEALFMLGRYSEAADAFLGTTNLSNRRRTFLAAMLAKAGRSTEAVAQLDAIARSDQDWDHLGNARLGYRYETPSDSAHLEEAIRLSLEIWKGKPENTEGKG